MNYIPISLTYIFLCLELINKCEHANTLKEDSEHDKHILAKHQHGRIIVVMAVDS